MQFFNGITLPDLIDKEVDLFVTDNKGGKSASLALCKAFMKKDRLWIDCVRRWIRRTWPLSPTSRSWPAKKGS